MAEDAYPATRFDPGRHQLPPTPGGRTRPGPARRTGTPARIPLSTAEARRVLAAHGTCARRVRTRRARLAAPGRRGGRQAGAALRRRRQVLRLSRVLRAAVAPATPDSRGRAGRRGRPRLAARARAGV